jgi:Spy/CpxP family protein refolding chaperone
MSYTLPALGAALMLATLPALAAADPAADAAVDAAADAAPPAASAPAKPAPKEVRVERRVVIVDPEGVESEFDPADVMDDPEVRAEILRMREAGGPGGRMQGPGGPGAPTIMMMRRVDGPGAGPRGPGAGKGRGDAAARLQRMANELGLAPEQRKQVRGIYDAARPQTEANRSQLRAERQRLRDVDPGDRNHAATVAAASKRIGELTAQKVQQEGELRRKVWQLLTPEQRAKADAQRAEVRKRRAEEADRLERRARELRGGTTTR